MVLLGCIFNEEEVPPGYFKKIGTVPLECILNRGMSLHLALDNVKLTASLCSLHDLLSV